MAAQQSKRQYFFLSFFALLAMRYASTTNATPQAPQEIVQAACQTVDQPNPIASLYPMNATGVLNGTVSVVPISLELARQLIPSQYRILEHAYRHLLPSFPKGMYPAVLQAVHDHDVQAFGFQVPDFSRAGIEFPFLDLLGDNTTSFKWVPSLLMTAENEMALKGAADYGTKTYPSSFDPACDAYSAVPNAKKPGTTSFSAKSSNSTAASINTQFSLTSEEVYPIGFFMNVTNQVIFADAKTCDNMIRLFNTSLTTSPYTIETVKGTVKAKMFPFESEQEWECSHGIRFASAFIENNYLPCENFRNYGA
ncbi:hypothetical protein ACET3X_001628 [Alternaria dauci]|uniref:Uncharacterized protein n=1 Tax=Alternaria dauci TaxID=48095 RepID=A0ABR3UXW2_9PLEO